MQAGSPQQKSTDQHPTARQANSSRTGRPLPSSVT